MAHSGFRFGRILRLKTQLRKVAQDEILMLRRDLTRVEKEMADVEVARTRNLAAATRAALEGRKAGDLQLHEAYDRAQQALRRVLRARADAIREALEARRLIVIERRREERQFECLETRQREREEAAGSRGEANLQDDLARRMRRGVQAGLERARQPGVRVSGHLITDARRDDGSWHSPKKERRS